MGGHPDVYSDWFKLGSPERIARARSHRDVLGFRILTQENAESVVFHRQRVGVNSALWGLLIPA